MRLILLTFFVLMLFSCSKQQTSKEPSVANMEIVSATTSRFAVAGQNIVALVKIAVPSVSGEGRFIGFEIIESPAKNFAVRAKQYFKPSNQAISLPVYSEFDTTAVISTQSAGMYILHFYNASYLLKSDTVQVN